MPLHRSQGKLRPQTPRPDELPNGVRPPRDHLFKAGPAQSATASLGGNATREVNRLKKALGLKVADPDHPMAPYVKWAREFRSSYLERLAREVGAGFCSEAVEEFVDSAVLAFTSKRYLYNIAKGNPELLAQARANAAAGRAELLCAFELCAKEAVHRKRNAPDPKFLKQQEFQRNLAANALARDALAKAAPK